MPPSTFSKTALEHLALVLSLAGGAAVALRVLGVASLDPDTALILLQTQGTGAVIFGSLMPILAVLPIGAGALLWAVAIKRGKVRSRLGGVAAVLFFTGALVVPLVVVLMLGLPILFNSVSARASRRRVSPTPGTHARPSKVETIFTALAVVLVATASLLLLISTQPWIPSEAIQPPQQDAFTGFVLDENDDQLTVLQNDPRKVIRIPAEGVTRDFCRISNSDNRLSGVLSQRPIIFHLAPIPEAEPYDTCPREK